MRLSLRCGRLGRSLLRALLCQREAYALSIKLSQLLTSGYGTERASSAVQQARPELGEKETWGGPLIQLEFWSGSDPFRS